jgi:hypothetical protein
VRVALSPLRAGCSLARNTPALEPRRLPPERHSRMKVAGASRRSAAPGSQSVGVAEYGDDSFARLCQLGPCAERNDSSAPLPTCKITHRARIRPSLTTAQRASAQLWQGPESCSQEATCRPNMRYSVRRWPRVAPFRQSRYANKQFPRSQRCGLTLRST